MDAAVAVAEPLRRYKTVRNGDLHFDIDLIDKCNLQCPTCFRGTGAQKNSHAALPLDKFRPIVAKAKAEGYPNICLINWTEAFLLKNLDQYVAIVKEFDDLDCWISSNLSLPPDRYLPSIISALRAGVDILFASVSGWSQEVYEINHKKGRIDWIRENLTAIAAELRAGNIETGVYIRYLHWPYNDHEVRHWQEFADTVGIRLDVVPAYGDPLQPLPGNEAYGQHVKNVLASADGPSPRPSSIPEKVCGLIMDRAALDANGDAYLCCAFPNAPGLKIGSYMAMSETEFLLKRHLHPFCTVCQIPRRETTERDRERLRAALGL